MGRGIKQLLGLVVLGAIAYGVFFVSVDGQTPYEHARQKVKDTLASAKESVKLDDGRSPFPEVDETLKPQDEYEDYDQYAPNDGHNNPGRRLNQQIQNAAQQREQRMQRKQSNWQ
jgi:hypothetical protein